MPVHKVRSRLMGGSIETCFLLRHIGQTHEAISPHQARGVLFCCTICLHFSLPSNMSFHGGYLIAFLPTTYDNHDEARRVDIVKGIGSF